MDEDIRIGAFICDCGSNIAGIVNVPEVVEYARGLKDVVFADEGKWSCSVDYLATMKELIKEQGINRVVIASCTPRTHEPLFKRTIKEAGLNPYLLEFVSIREQSSWVHRDDPQKATEKAKDLVKMGVAKAALLEKGEEIRLPVNTDCLIIGGGMAGMNAALNIADQGFHAILVEKESRLGGLVKDIAAISYNNETVPADEIVNAKVALIDSHPNITVYTNAEIETVEGYIGNYKVTVKADGSREDLDVSTIIVATGMKEIEPVGQFEYGRDPRVITQLQFEGMLKKWNGECAKGNGKIANSKSQIKNNDVVIINCVNSKNESRGCCAIGCHISVKNALALKARNYGARVHILYRDLSMVREEGSSLEAAKKAGVRFIRFPDDRYPEMREEDGRLSVLVNDLLLGEELTIPADLIVLTTGFKGNDTVDDIKGLLKISANPDGFFQEAHIKLGPLDFPSDGISLCGCARSPKSLKEAMEEGTGAAMRASIPMKQGFLEAEGIVADIDLDLCTSCGLCEKNCPYGAIQWVDEKPQVIKALCKGCGLCAADCPKKAITIIHYSDEQILAQMEAALEERAEEKIIGFVCHWCALGGVDMAGVSRLQYPSNARLIRVMCSARVSIDFIERAFELGAAGVLVAGCEFPTCHYITGNYAAEERIKKARKRLARKGYDPNRLWNIWCSAADGPKFANTMRDMVKKLGL
ncbi:MAG: hydrogenase iron-sulfur subunit [Deltaproteobacteria bacterium]|nr:hydrogenase iron-sulfur subunit [Deltaproteobacteria bacterium]